MLPTAASSAFMNNTPLVAMLIPAVNDWAKHHRLAVSKLMIPLSYAAILGGACTLIGTSTNLVVDGQLKDEAKRQIAASMSQGLSESEARLQFEEQTGLPAEGLGMFTIAWVGLPGALLGCGFIVLCTAGCCPTVGRPSATWTILALTPSR